MLIRFATENDLPEWYALATEVSPIFRHPADMGTDPEFISYAKSKVSKYEALTAVDYMSGHIMGFIGLSRTHNRITWFGVSNHYRRKGVGNRLLKTALRQLDHTKPITVETFPEGYEPGIPAKCLYRKFGFVESESNLIGPHDTPICRMTVNLSGEERGASFHYRYTEFIHASHEDKCPVCNDEPAPVGQTVIELNDKVWICAEYPGQGRLFGKMYVMPRKHFFHFEDIPQEEMVNFMSEVQRVGAALHKVTGAEKINYEMHSNSGAHLHIHLFPRYLDDDFPSAPIDYRVSEPAPYESYEEYLWFIKQMKKELARHSIMPKGIAIVGGNGSGKTTLGATLSKELNYKHMDIEAYYFKETEIPYSESRTYKEVMQLIEMDITKYPNFIISAVNGDLGDKINSLYDCVIYLKAPLDIRMIRIKQRAYHRFGDRVLEGGDMYEQEQKFLDSVVIKNMEKTDEWLQGLSCPIIYVDGTKPIDETIKLIRTKWTEFRPEI